MILILVSIQKLTSMKGLDIEDVLVFHKQLFGIGFNSKIDKLDIEDVLSVGF